MRRFVGIFLFFLTALPALAQGTHTWEQSRFEEFMKGNPQGVAISNNGEIQLAPEFRSLTTTPATYIWDIASDGSGNVYAATGSPARVYSISPTGDYRVIFESQELQVQSIVVGGDGALYAATNPDGKVYRIAQKVSSKTKSPPPSNESRSDWSATVYFEPHTKYIWDLAVDDGGDVFVATGDRGEIFRVTPRQQGSIFFKSEEAHIRVLRMDSNGNLIAGSDGSGLVYRISPAGEAFVLYAAPKPEITALAIDRAGNIYAAAAGEKHSGGIHSVSTPLTAPPATPPSSHGKEYENMGLSLSNAPSPATPSLAPNPTATGAAPPGGSEVYRIATDGLPTRLWSSHEDLVYALAFDSKGRLLAGTGNRGHIFAILGDDDYSDMLKAPATQVTSFAPAPDGGLYASTSNLGKIFTVLSTVRTQGVYESDVLDARIFSRWGRVQLRGQGNIALFARSGNVENPDRNWSPWMPIDLQHGAEITAPAARYLQWKAVLRSGQTAPRLNSVLVNYLPKNVPPNFDEVIVQTGRRHDDPPHSPGDASSSSSSQNPVSSHDRNSIGIRWNVHDDNDDQMVYSVFYRAEGNGRWLPLAQDLTDKFYSFDATLLPDDAYTVKVVASDAPSHSPGGALTAERESARFEVDTTPPLIHNLTAEVKGRNLRVAFQAKDNFSNLKRAEFSVDAGDWQFVAPVGELSDSPSESYDFTVPLPEGSAGGSEHVVVVRVYDKYDNGSSAKTLIRPATGRAAR